MDGVNYGRKVFSFSNGVTSHTSTSITEKSMPGENEQAFTERLARKYARREGTIEIVFKKGRPDYAVITFA
jgi:hypothetical protein